MEQEKNHIQRLDEFTKAVYDKFILKKGFWWGCYNGCRIAFCGKVSCDNKVKVYLKHGERWMPFLLERDALKSIYPNLTI